MDRHQTSLKSRILSVLLLGLAVTLYAAGSADAFSYHYKVKRVSVTGGFTYQGTGNGAQESGSIFWAKANTPSRDAKQNAGFLRYPRPHRFAPIGVIKTPEFKQKYQKEARGIYDGGAFSEPQVISCPADLQPKLDFSARLGYNAETKQVAALWNLGFDPLDCQSGFGEAPAGFIIEPANPYDGPCKGYLVERYPLKTFEMRDFTLPLSLKCDWTPDETNSQTVTASREAHIAWNGQVVLRRVPEPDRK
jgi:hypothetical protein